jgi:hypothetical protein
MNIIESISLRPLLGLSPENGWETSVGQAFNNIFYTANYFAAYSGDDGNSFSYVDPNEIAKLAGESFCCDQDAIFFPAGAAMAWVLLTNEGSILLCLARVNDMKDTQGKSWTIYKFSAPAFAPGIVATFDYPKLAVVGGHLFLTANIVGAGSALVARIPAGQVLEMSTLHFQYFIAKGHSYLFPAQGEGLFDNAFFATFKTTSEIRIFKWRSSKNYITIHDIPISTVPTEDWVTPLPSPDQNKDWLAPTTKVQQLTVKSAAVGHDEIWVAWTGGRKVKGSTKAKFKNPHIGMARISLATMKLSGERFFHNPDFAFAYPSLAADANGEIAIAYMWGGIRQYVQHGVAFLTKAKEETPTSSDVSIGGGGHYITLRRGFPNVFEFVLATFNSPKDDSLPQGAYNKPMYIRFKR